jgi:hypothetical protein
MLKCKNCGDERPELKPLILYQKTESRIMSHFQGQIGEQKTIYVDSGVFCDDRCLLEYLERKAKQKL